MNDRFKFVRDTEMDKNGIWYWYDHEPVPDNIGTWLFGGDLYELSAFNIAPFDGGWQDSLMECGNHIADASKKV